MFQGVKEKMGGNKQLKVLSLNLSLEPPLVFDSDSKLGLRPWVLPLIKAAQTWPQPMETHPKWCKHRTGKHKSMPQCMPWYHTAIASCDQGHHHLVLAWTIHSLWQWFGVFFVILVLKNCYMNCTLAVACGGLHVACNLLQAIHRTKLQTVAVFKPVKDLRAATGVHFQFQNVDLLLLFWGCFECCRGCSWWLSQSGFFKWAKVKAAFSVKERSVSHKKSRFCSCQSRM